MKNIQSSKQGNGSNRGFCIVCFTLVLVLAVISILFTGCHLTTDNGPCQHTKVIAEGKPATCLEDGLTEGLYCSKCNEAIQPQEVIPKLGHNAVVYAAAPAHCLTSGLADGSHCDRCGEIIVAQEEIKALGHNIVIDEAV
ncbi:MAG: hypothetical protein J6Q06_04475, partial [Clostridia bacterium]|nr:hypothetical protein [Clostridia bacterium]